MTIKPLPIALGALALLSLSFLGLPGDMGGSDIYVRVFITSYSAYMGAWYVSTSLMHSAFFAGVAALYNPFMESPDGILISTIATVLACVVIGIDLIWRKASEG